MAGGGFGKPTNSISKFFIMQFSFEDSFETFSFPEETDRWRRYVATEKLFLTFLRWKLDARAARQKQYGL